MTDTDAFYAQLQEAIETDQLILPTLPEVALKIRDEVEGSDCSALDVANLLAQDGALSAHFIRVANSPMYRAQTELGDLQTIVSRLGMTMVKDLVISLAMKQIFMATSDTRDMHFRNAWSKSVGVASISRVLATMFSGLKPEQALLAGLVHNIGTLPILVMAEKNDSFDDAQLDEIIRELQSKVGHLVLKSWNFPQYLIDVVNECFEFERERENADYVDVVQMSLLQGGFIDNLAEESLDQANFSVFNRLNMDPDSNMIDSEENKVAIEETKKSLLH